MVHESHLSSFQLNVMASTLEASHLKQIHQVQRSRVFGDDDLRCSSQFDMQQSQKVRKQSLGIRPPSFHSMAPTSGIFRPGYLTTTRPRGVVKAKSMASSPEPTVGKLKFSLLDAVKTTLLASLAVLLHTTSACS